VSTPADLTKVQENKRSLQFVHYRVAVELARHTYVRSVLGTRNRYNLRPFRLITFRAYAVLVFNLVASMLSTTRPRPDSSAIMRYRGRSRILTEFRFFHTRK